MKIQKLKKYPISTGAGTPPPHTAHSPKHLWRLDSRAFGTRPVAPQTEIHTGYAPGFWKGSRNVKNNTVVVIVSLMT